MKRCTKCGAIKALSEFYAAKGTRDGLRGECKSCFAARAKVWYAKNRERAIENVKAWQRANPERVQATRKAVRERRKAQDREAHLQRTFGIDTAEYEALLRAQGGRCRICGRLPRKGSALHVDHDHATGKVRGLLCFRCNGGLGQFGDDPNQLAVAIEYLAGELEATPTRRLLHGMTIARARGLVGVSG
jgi:hypothetical protein